MGCGMVQCGKRCLSVTSRPEVPPTKFIDLSRMRERVSKWHTLSFAHARVGIPVKPLPATAKAKHLAGCIEAPVYLSTNPALAKLVRPTAQPTAKGPINMPKSFCCRGSSPTPKARNLQMSVLMCCIMEEANLHECERRYYLYYQDMLHCHRLRTEATATMITMTMSKSNGQDYTFNSLIRFRVTE